MTRRQELLPGKYERKKVAEKGLRDALGERERGDYVAPVDLSTADYLEKRWLASLGAEGKLAPNTLLAYGLHVKRINAHIGHIALQKLTRSDVAVMAANLASEKAGSRPRPLPRQPARDPRRSESCPWRRRCGRSAAQQPRPRRATAQGAHVRTAYVVA